MRARLLFQTFWIALAMVAIAQLFAAPTTSAAPGPGIVQATWNANEIGTEVFTFPAASVGPQPTMVEFQHGYLYFGAARSVDQTVPGRVSWWDVSNPRSPSLITYVNAGNSKAHMIAFWEDKMLDGFTESVFQTWDFDDQIPLGSYSGVVSPVWYMGQIPYVFRPRNGYATGANNMEIVKLNAAGTGGSQIALFDLGSAVGFAVGSVHAVGNLLICSASNASGVATFDISDPASPTLLDQLVTGGDIYTSMVHGTRLFVCEIGPFIRVYDFANPADIQYVGSINIGWDPRYVILKDGKGYTAPGWLRIMRFDAQTLAVEDTWITQGKMDFVQPVGNMAVTGGQEGAGRCSIVPIQEAPDMEGPSVGFVNPANGAQFQALTSRVGFIMSELVDVTSLTSSTFIVRPLGTTIPVAGTYSTQLGMINFAPDAPLMLDTTYEVILPAGGVRDLVGNPTATQFYATFSTGIAIPAGIVLHWRLDDSVADESDLGQDLTLVNGPTFSSVEKQEGSHSLSLDGVDDYATAGTINLGDHFSIAAWVKTPGSAADTQTIAANSASGMGADGFRFFVNSPGTSDGKIIFETGNGSAGAAVATDAGIFVPDAWNHVAVSVDRTLGLARIYHNGDHRTTSWTVRTDFVADEAVDLGRMTDGSHLEGFLDDVRIFPVALTGTQVDSLFAGSPVGGNNPPVISSLVASDSQPLVGAAVSFTATATDSDSGDILLYSFSFGDGSPATAFASSNVANNTYAAPGRHIVSARVSDGATLVTRQELVVAHHPIASPAPVTSSQIVHDAPRGKTWCVNPDSGTVSRISATPPFAKELELPTGVNPRSLALTPDGSALWVVCKGSDEIQVFNPVTGTVVTTTQLDHGAAPVALVFAPNGSAAFVATGGSRALLKLNVLTVAVTGTLPLAGEPFSVAISGDSSRALVARLISPESQGEVWEIDPATMALVRTLVLGIDMTPDTENSGRGLPNYLQSAAITPDGRRAWVPSKKDNILRGTFRDGQPLDHDNTVRSIISQLDLVANQEDAGARRDVDDHGLPGGVCFSPLGDIAFVANQGKNVVLAFDAASGNALSSVETGRAPQSLCFDAANSRLFVMNFLARSISVYDVAGLLAGTSSAMTLLAETPVVTLELLSTQVLEGKRIFYNSADERMAAEGYISCASCHLDGGHDGRTWDFTDRGEGLRNTTDLRGRGGMVHGKVHWTANFDEIQDFEHDMRGGFGGMGFMSNAAFNTGTRNQPLGDPKAGVSAELDALAAYVASLTEVGRSPYRNPDGTMTDNGLAGKAVFHAANCASCHLEPLFTDSPFDLRHDVGTMTAASGQRLGQPLDGIDTPTLLGLWGAPPYHHLGDAAAISDVLANSAHGTAGALTSGQKNEIVSYLLELDRFEADADLDGLDDDWELTYAVDLFDLGEKGNPSSGADADGDGSSDAAEQTASTNPVDPNDFLRVVFTANNGGTFDIHWPSVTGKTYDLNSSTDLATWTLHSSYPGTGAVIAALVNKTALGNPERVFFRVETSE